MSETATQELPDQDIEVEGDSSNESLIPYSFAKKHNVLVHTDDDGTTIVSCVDTPKLAVLAELKRRCAGFMTKVVARRPS